jgi:hypothetical protein
MGMKKQSASRKNRHQEKRIVILSEASRSFIARGAVEGPAVGSQQG